jgi:glycerol-3-phosphate dehydrogenase (NAD(P)+)
MQTTILIIGAGEIGQALAEILTPNHDLTIHLWDKDPRKSRSALTLPALVAAADQIFLAIPAHAIRTVIKSIAKKLHPATLIICLSKSLDHSTGETTDQLLEDELPAQQPFFLLNGPMIAEELCQGGYGYAMLASHKKNNGKTVIATFKKSLLHFQVTSDLRGVAVAGVMKNVYAMALGIADGLHWCHNERGWLVMQCLDEMKEVISLLGGKKTTGDSLAGIADLIATGSSDNSCNYRYGKYLVQKTGAGTPGEGSRSVPLLYKRLKNKTAQLPILNALIKILVKKYHALTVFDNLRTQQR